MKIEVRGLSRLKKGISNAPRVVKKGLNDAVSKSALIVERESKLSITRLVYNKPYRTLGYTRTGRLRASISHETRLGKHPSARISPHTKYAFFVHEGRGSSKSYGRRPFMEEGLKVGKPPIEKIFKKLGERVVISIAK